VSSREPPIRVLLPCTDDSKVAKERMHLDLESDDVEAEVQRFEALGAPAGTTNRNAATTSGSCATRGATSSASSNRSTPSCSTDGSPGNRRTRTNTSPRRDALATSAGAISPGDGGGQEPGWRW
jgi:hypothetical protein